ncbi:hypothetical protein BESB_035840 [Besnoitia besnoiti]|uniref:Uncharacterized protein n=1 Tax=Besnoitia besnoiti TaxID=94643 RepID=A0A2A9MM26_BESBE|nr:hypothetical protein BESB_035840 [Besnoitia besnoiti]PFH37126.1 hypothetical protein BESB_035840 [Besnoitia besnoiti]
MASAADDDYLRTGGVNPSLSILSPASGLASPSLASSVSVYASQPGASLSARPARVSEELYLNGYGKQFGDKITYSAGVSYAAGKRGAAQRQPRRDSRAETAASPPPHRGGDAAAQVDAWLSLGALYGVGVGIQRGGSTARLRLNALLNGCSEYAPKAGAQLGTITLFYCCFNNLLGLFREDEPTNAPIAGAAAGALYKSLASWKVLGAYSLTSSLIFTGIDQYLRKYV